MNQKYRKYIYIMFIIPKKIIELILLNLNTYRYIFIIGIFCMELKNLLPLIKNALTLMNVMVY